MIEELDGVHGNSVDFETTSFALVAEHCLALVAEGKFDAYGPVTYRYCAAVHVQCQSTFVQSIAACVSVKVRGPCDPLGYLILFLQTCEC